MSRHEEKLLIKKHEIIQVHSKKFRINEDDHINELKDQI